jgi:CcmD family protein
MAYLVAGYFVFWAVTFLFVYAMYRRQAALERELAALREELEHRGK